MPHAPRDDDRHGEIAHFDEKSVFFPNSLRDVGGVGGVSR